MKPAYEERSLDPLCKPCDTNEDRPPSRVYLDFYNLRESPFSITPDPEFLYMSPSHKTVAEKILYGIQARMGFLLLIGEVGSGKTTLCRIILDELTGKAETVYLINPSLSGMDLIQSILDDLGIEYPSKASKKELLNQLNNFLIAKSKEKPVVIIIDDAQTMTVEGLETLRLLSNLETDKEKLIQLLLVGQQELQETLSRPELRQLQQRISIKCRLDLLQKTDIPGYISHRLFVAGDKGNIRFTPGAINTIYKTSHGIPRLINKICDYSLIAGYVSNSFEIERSHVVLALDELKNNLQENRHNLLNTFSLMFKKRGWLELAMAGLCVFLLLGYFVFDLPVRTGGSTISQANEISKPPEPAAQVLVIASPLPNSISAKEPDISSATLVEKLQSKQTPVVKPAETHQSYILQIASYNKLSDVLKAVSIYKEKNIDAHWNSVESGDQSVRYRVYAGRFPTMEAAEEFKNSKGLSEGVAVYAPWSVEVAVSKNKTDLINKCPELRQMGIDCILEGDDASGYKVASGAFKTSESAVKSASTLAKNGIDAKVVFE